MAHSLDEQTSPHWKSVLVEKMVLDLNRLSSCRKLSCLKVATRLQRTLACIGLQSWKVRLDQKDTMQLKTPREMRQT